ncbi:UNVERIFIED_CONTAM: hypothetical protein GTU68_037712 [Idotea baltica]|nr:hypothetical protein [Idotea baltica]
MLQAIEVGSLDDLIDQTVPASIRNQSPLNTPEALSEFRYLQVLKQIASQNQVFTNYLGQGYYDTQVPAVIQRNILENPGWYTQYTPYQAEIAQGRLEALLNFQTMVSDLTGMELANASLLDEATAAAEAMAMLFSDKNKRNKGELINQFLVSSQVFPHTLELLNTRAEPLGVEVVVTDAMQPTEKTFGIFLQYPGQNGVVKDLSAEITAAKAAGVYVVVASDLMALCLLKSPGEMGADVVVGNTQRFGVPMGFGGPHAGFFACQEKFKRQIPGRIIGVSKDRDGNPGLRMALQTREQHIKRERATSNICTAQALLAIMAGMYAVYHGPEGLKAIARRLHAIARLTANELNALGFSPVYDTYFDTLTVDLGGHDAATLRGQLEAARINIRYIDNHKVGISIDETTSLEEVDQLISVFASLAGKSYTPGQLLTKVDALDLTYAEHQVFNSYRSESEMMRYIKRLENKDLSLAHSMIPLGSCTMKLNAAAELMPITWPEFANIHPFAPIDQAQGYLEMLNGLESYLNAITGFTATSLQPNSGAQGEYAGLMVIRAYHLDRGDEQRKVVLIPSSAHGTNPASAVMAGMKVVVTPCDEMGNIRVDALREKAIEHSHELAGLMVTYPSTHGVFEEAIREICDLIHEHGGMVYMDGANMNAQVGLTSPANIGADVCHLNLHKTFAIPHGGGGPGMGPICCNDKLAPYLPGHLYAETGGDKAITAISAAPWGSALILLISYGYIRMLGPDGLTDSTRNAILNANYLKTSLSEHYDVLYVGENGRVAHEFILDMRKFKQSAGIEVVDVAKRLMDYGFHAPTVSFPVPGTMMIEPTESESKAELDRFILAMISIRKEIQDVEIGLADMQDNVLKNAPHTVNVIVSEDWNHQYDREKAAFPLPYVRAAKFWPAVSRVDDSFGDRNLVCTCPPMEMYMD